MLISIEWPFHICYNICKYAVLLHKTAQPEDQGNKKP